MFQDTHLARRQPVYAHCRPRHRRKQQQQKKKRPGLPQVQLRWQLLKLPSLRQQPHRQQNTRPLVQPLNLRLEARIGVTAPQCMRMHRRVTRLRVRGGGWRQVN